ncbi:MAG: hypothetical protein U5R06_19425 [candidate division KSB1 bacterium]|nr:hypothetical protein [candidate division KSB1 bacterium]
MLRAVFLFCLLWGMSLWAVNATLVTLDSRSEFEQGTPKNVSIGKDGELRTSPRKQSLLMSTEPVVWKLVKDSDGIIYASTGNQGRIYKISGSDTSLFYTSDKLAAYAMSVDKDDNLIIGTSPNGLLQRITPEGKVSDLYNPDAVYIWDIDIAPDGSIWVATGDTARVYHISAEGTVLQRFTPDAQHVRCLSLYGGAVYAGTSGDGHIYRIRENDMFVLFDTMMEEVIDLFVRPEGVVYAAAMSKAMLHPFAASVSSPDESSEDSESSGMVSATNGLMSPQMSSLNTSLFRITSHGYGKELWQGSKGVIQSIAPLEQDILVGTGEEGRCYRMTPDGEKTLLYQMDESHVSALFTTSDDVLIGTSNLGHVYRLIDEPAKNACYLSKPIDSDVRARWGALQWESKGPVKAIQFYTRSGNTKEPGTAWSAWQPVAKDQSIASPESRFLQWKVELKNESAIIEKVTVSYLQANLQPEITSLFLHSHNTFFEHKDQDKAGLKFPQSPSSESEKQGYRSVEWQFQDPNYDGLLFSVYYQKKNSSYWRQMKDEWALNYYSWDTQHMSDGYYRVKIEASDAPDNPKGRELASDKISDTFLVDNTPPVLKHLTAKDSVLSFTVYDAWSRIKNVWYSENAREWQDVFPRDDIADSKSENYKVQLSEPNADIAIKVQDEFGNVNVYPVKDLN